MVSSVAITETQFADQFRDFLNTSDNELRSFRKEAFEFFRENGFPSVKNENWKYTNVAPIVKENWKMKSNARSKNLKHR